MEIVTKLKYLGMTLTSQCLYTNQIKRQITKAKSKICYLFCKLNLALLPLELAIQVFQVYALPIIIYGLAIWRGLVSQNILLRVWIVCIHYI